MLIESIKLENFRQFQNESITFADGSDGKNVTQILLYEKSIESSSVPLRSCTIDAQSSNFILRSCAFL